MLSSSKSTWVRTPMVLRPSLSIYRASLRDSELAESSVAFDTATMMQFGFFMYPLTILMTCSSMSFGWSPTGFFMMPGKSTNKRSRTFLEYSRILKGTLLIPLFWPHAF
jgi:hypothetical protein